MTYVHPTLEDECFFKNCRYRAVKNLAFRGNVVKVCSMHYRTYSTSHEAKQKHG